MSLIAELRTKIRALCEDFSKTDTDSFTYETGDKVFTLEEDNVTTLSSVSVNGVELGSGEFSFDADTSELTISSGTGILSSGDIVTVKYIYYKYTDSELSEYIRSALVWLSIYAYCKDDYEMEDNEIFPTPDNKTEDLIAIVSSILIKPDYSEYRLPTITVKYPRTMCKEERIENLIQKFQISLGVNDTLDFT